MQIALNSLRTLLFRVPLVALGQILALLIARWLGPQGNGLYTLATSYGAIGTTLMSGGMVAVAHEISHRGSDSRSAAANVAVLSLGLGLVPVVVALFLWPVLNAHGWWWLLPVALAQPPVLLSSALVGVFLGVDDIKRLNYAYVGPWAATLAVFLVMTVLFGRSARVALVSWAIGQSLAAIYSVWLAHPLWSPLALGSVTLQRLRGLIKFGGQAGIANLISFLNYRMDAFMVVFYLGEKQLGIYAAAVKVAEGLWFFSTAIWTAAYARIGSLSDDESARLTARGMRHSLFIIAIIAVGLLLITDPLLSLLYGSAYRGAITPFRWLVPGIAFYGLAGILSAYYTNQLGRPRVPLLIAGCSMLLNVIACAVMIPAFGLSGAAIASTLGYTIAIVAGMIAFLHTTSLGWRETLVVNSDDLRDYLRILQRIVGLVRSAAPVSPS
ncbi:MAG: flippase [Dehalococcoidia bacterium]